MAKFTDLKNYAVFAYNYIYVIYIRLECITYITDEAAKLYVYAPYPPLIAPYTP